MTDVRYTDDGQPIYVWCEQCNTLHLSLGFCPARMARGEAEAASGNVTPAETMLRKLREKLGAQEGGTDG